MGYDWRRSPVIFKSRAVAARKILYIIGSLDLGGAERHLALITPRLKQLGWQPVIYCISRRGIQSRSPSRTRCT